MKNIDISIRMKAVADMTVMGHIVADIGCDHAFIPIYLIKNHIAPRVIASDVRSGPCGIAKKNIETFGLSDVIELRLGDGLETVRPGEADTIIIAGMGGMLMNSIINHGYETAASAKQLILQPQSDIDKVRENVLSKGWQIISEEMLIDMGKYYTILNITTVGAAERFDAERSDMLTQVYLRYGKYLIEQKHAVLKEYLLKKYQTNGQLLENLYSAKTEKARFRYDEVMKEQKLIDKALEMMNQP